MPCFCTASPHCDVTPDSCITRFLIVSWCLLYSLIEKLHHRCPTLPCGFLLVFPTVAAKPSQGSVLLARRIESSAKTRLIRLETLCFLSRGQGALRQGMALLRGRQCTVAAWSCRTCFARRDCEGAGGRGQGQGRRHWYVVHASSTTRPLNLA